MQCAYWIKVSRRAISIAGRSLASSQLKVDATDLPECLSTWTGLQLTDALIQEENCRSAVVPTCLVFKTAFPPYNEADDTIFSALPVGRCSRKRRIRPLLKQTLPL